MNPIIFPPVSINKQGGLRRVGVELEYAGLPLPRSAALVAGHYGGTVREESLNHYCVETPRFGTFSIKLDMALMQRISTEAARQRQTDPEHETLETMAEKVLSPIVSTWVPNEIVTPPIPLDALEEVDGLCRLLAEHGAKGTDASPIYAFGLHLNPEMPDIPPERLKDYLAAFVLLQDWLKEQTRMDFTRQITTFAKLFPVEYGRVLLAENYAPDLATLIDDYLAFNPTRNRALDMLPLFCHFDEARVRRAVDDPRVRARPTFHYRLPNCSINDPGWSIVREWGLWVAVEQLAEDTARLKSLAADYMARTTPLTAMLGFT